MKFQRIALFSFGVKTTLMLAHTQDLSVTRFQTIIPNCSIEQNTCEKTWDEHVYFLHWQCAVLREEEAPGQTRGDPGGEAAGWVEARCRHLHSSAGGVREQSQLTSYTNTIVYSLSSSEPCKKYTHCWWIYKQFQHSRIFHDITQDMLFSYCDFFFIRLRD